MHYSHDWVIEQKRVEWSIMCCNNVHIIHYIPGDYLCIYIHIATGEHFSCLAIRWLSDTFLDNGIFPIASVYNYNNHLKLKHPDEWKSQSAGHY